MPLSESTIRAHYGQTRKAVEANLVHIVLFGHSIPVNKRHADHWKAWEACVREFERVHKIAHPWHPRDVSSYCWRPMRSNPNRLSHHSFGIAVDFDPDQNPMVSAGEAMHTNIPHYVVGCANVHNIEWGGSWHSPRDPMHFELNIP